MARRGEYALILQDAPVAQKTHSRAELDSSAARAHLQAIRQAQAVVLAELRRRSVPVTYASQLLVNAVFVRTTRETAAQLRNIPGVMHVQYLPPVKRDLNTALNLENVSAAWSALGGASNAGAGIKIGIIDTGIDQNHPGFQTTSKPPSGFPKGDSNYTNNKVIVARSYVSTDVSQNYTSFTARSGDDTSPRDRTGHGTAIAMIAAGVQNTGPVATIQGMAPGALLGNYKVFGSPGVYDFAFDSVIVQALTDAVADGMDIVTLSLNGGDPAQYGPLDVDPSCDGQCDVRAQAVESAFANGLVVVASAGNDNGSGFRPITLSSIHTPGTAPSAITVGATTNAHLVFQAVHVTSSGAPANLQNIHALFNDGPHIAAALAGPLIDVTQLGNDGLACTALPSGSLSGAIAFIQRGTCVYSDKVNNAQNAGAVGVIVYQSSGLDNIYSAWFAQDTGIPAMMIGNTDGIALKNYVDANSGVTVSLDPSLSTVGGTQDQVASYSSRGPSLGNFAPSPVLSLKPELVAVGDGIYTAAQKLDPNGDTYNATGYAGVSGTSYAVPMVAGAVAMVKQKFPTLTPAQLKSAVVNTATTQNLIDVDGSANPRVNAVGAGKLSVGDAVSIAATLEPSTLSFGVVNAAAYPKLTLKLTNVSNSQATFNLSVQPRDTSSASVQLSSSSITLNPGANSTLNVTPSGSQPAAGSYEGFIQVTGAGPTLRVPYEFLVGSGVPYDMFPILDGGFLGGVSDQGWPIAFRLVDQYGVPVRNTPIQFSVVKGGGSIALGDDQTANYGLGAADVNLGNTQGDQFFQAAAGGLSYTFQGYARNYPAITNVVDGATFRAGQGLAPGSYITIQGSALADATEAYSTPSLPVSLSYGSVSFDGGGLSVPGHLTYVSPGQINVQIPWEFQGQKSVQMTVWSNYLATAQYTVPLAAASPGVFATVDANSNTVVTSSTPVKRGDTLTLYANGLGPVAATPVSGEPTAAVTNTVVTPTVTLGGVDLAVSFSGLIPPYVGLYQVNAAIPANTPTGSQPLVISVGGVSSPAINLTVQ
ncbi:Peptidase S8 and S53, subtilisin, kexin, sedolisin [Candidatus Sulfopaludibacter sp. SbA3]|nr:Peptidase S8 and S53, subtilisin, kexin, sedolisin [Candidatus Sulfopaludibacter sp. SbA3]